jgi:hypothetical protein
MADATVAVAVATEVHGATADAEAHLLGRKPVHKVAPYFFAPTNDDRKSNSDDEDAAVIQELQMMARIAWWGGW